MGLFSRKRKTKQSKFRPLTGDARRLSEYWLDALKEAERTGMRQEDAEKNGLEVPLSELQSGMCTAHCVRLLKEKERSRLEQKDRGRKKESFGMRVVVSPLYFRRRRGGRGRRSICVLWIPALLAADGSLAPPVFGAPWIPRICLEPAIGEEAPAVAAVEDLENFAESDPPQDWRSWKEYWRYCEKFCRRVLGAKISSVAVEGYERQDSGYAALDLSSGSSSGLVRLLSETAEGRRNPGLFPAFAAVKEPQRQDYSRSMRVLARSAYKHCAQFGKAFPLAPSQREAVHRFMETPEGDFLCVTGPPGTGKTTLLQSIIASLWVQAVRYGAPPPVIVACGATNQSVMNIIDSLEKAGDDDQLLSRRWLPSLHSYGTFCCSAHKAPDAAGYQLELRDGVGLSYSMEQPQYIEAACSRFLASYAKWRGKEESLSKAASVLRKAVLSELDQLYRSLLQARGGGLADWLKTIAGRRPRTTAQEFFTTLAQFDATLRYRAFLLAAHYWEARWLLEAPRKKRSRDGDGSLPRFSGEISDWRRRAMITPAFVSTLAMVPKFFASRTERGEPPIDVLIFDEAGQAPVESGAACLCLAKRAVIVGDPAQLEPVRDIPPYIDRANAVRFRLMRNDDPALWKTLVRRGVTASAGSLMHLALRSTKWTQRSTYGVFLSEHRRSVPDIVRFTNTLAYAGRLQPLRAEIHPRILPAFGYLDVPGFCQQAGHSRYNRQEALYIAAWLEKREDELLQFYSASTLAEITAVLTPFAAQARLLKDLLLSRFPGLTVGSVNSLQGAERPVVIFSAVYDRNYEGKYFFDRGDNMLNVAVSRAQDSFIVFADLSIFRRDERTPSAILAHFLFEHAANEITDLDPVRRSSIPDEETNRLSTLESHRDALAEALGTAAHEIIISSPTISSPAIKADRIVEGIKAAGSRGVSVLVYTDAYLDRTDAGLKPNAAEGRRLLIEAGAQVRIAKGIHNKALAVDDATLIEGSFNWLSAVRSAGSLHQKHEVSWCYRGPKAAEAVCRLKEELEHRHLLYLDAEKNASELESPSSGPGAGLPAEVKRRRERSS